MKILITGCNGFIASNLIKTLLSKNKIIYCFSRDDKCNFKGDTFHFKYDLREKLHFNKFPSKIDVIYHLAAMMNKTISMEDMFKINTFSTYELINYALNSNVKQFIYSSSAGVYGYNKNYVDENAPLNPIGFYGLSKYLSEKIIDLYKNYFKNTTILRIAFPYGKNQERGLIPLLISKIKNNREIDIFNPKNLQKINPIYIDNLVKILNDCLFLEDYNIFNISGDDSISIKKLAQDLAKLFNLKSKFNYIKDKNIKNLLIDNHKMKKIFKFSPQKFNLSFIT
ncbi:MAG: NAD(P)-dependent oxidoreductase [Armatimonadetes bacterium]|nr:NAD(P)-dependent oxidoreductase [Armatimonadota bacterium]